MADQFQSSSTSSRVDWVDFAKGICIILVVLLHSTWGVQNAIGRETWMHAVSEFAAPFRMPDFFLISGLFLARTIDRDWRLYLDRKVVHFAYFYALWVTIQFAIKSPSFAADAGWSGVIQMYLFAYVQPFAMMWFIYLLPIFYVVTKLLRNVPPLAVFAGAAALEIAPIHTGWVVLDEFAWRYVYFYAGYILAPHIFHLARAVPNRPVLAAGVLTVWAAVNAVLVESGHATWPIVSLALGFAGAAAVLIFATLAAAADRARFLRYCGEHSIVIYLAFFLPMAVTRTALLKTGIVPDPGTIVVIVATAAVAGSLLMHLIVRDTPAAFLFLRPRIFTIVEAPTVRKPAIAAPVEDSAPQPAGSP